MKRFILIATLAAAMFAINSTDALSWGQKGHDITCAIAENHLSKKAQKQISQILDGKSIVYWANWLDNASHTPQYAYTKTWHYKNIDADETYETAAELETGDVLTAINAQVEALKSGKLNKEAQAIALRMLVHLVGDLHCPMHMGHRSDRGGNGWQVQFFGNGSNLHSIWDSGLLERAHGWTYSDWCDQLDRESKENVKAICKGTPYDWGKETYLAATEIYNNTPVGSKIYYNEVAEATPLIEQQLLKGGLRLASLLNEIFR